jgi:HNH endonuclease
MARNSARRQLREYFLANVGKVLDWQQLRKVAGDITEWARRVRELRDEEGMNIVTDKDRSELKPGQYLLVDTKPIPSFERAISKETRAFVLDRNGYTCQMCGLSAGDTDPNSPGRKIRLHIGHLIDKSMGGNDEPGNLRALCSNCNEGAANITLERPSYIKLATQVRRAASVDQLKLLKVLIDKFPKQGKEFLT